MTLLYTDILLVVPQRIRAGSSFKITIFKLLFLIISSKSIGGVGNLPGTNGNNRTGSVAGGCRVMEIADEVSGDGMRSDFLFF